DAGSLHRFADRGRTKFWCGAARQLTLKSAHGGSDAGKNDDIGRWHGSDSLARRCTRQLLHYHQNEMTGLISRFLEQLAPDQPAADFRCAGADLVELGVAQKPPGRIVIDVTIAAKTLDRLQRHPGAFFR